MLQILFFGESCMLDIGCYAHAQLQWSISLHVIVNIIKCKRMHGLNCLFFREQRLVFVIKNSTVYIGCYAHAQLQWGISLHVIVNIIKCKRMHGLNCLFFREQRLLFL